MTDTYDYMTTPPDERLADALEATEQWTSEPSREAEATENMDGLHIEHLWEIGS